MQIGPAFWRIAKSCSSQPFLFNGTLTVPKYYASPQNRYQLILRHPYEPYLPNGRVKVYLDGTPIDSYGNQEFRGAQIENHWRREYTLQVGPKFQFSPLEELGIILFMKHNGPLYIMKQKQKILKAEHLKYGKNVDQYFHQEVFPLFFLLLYLFTCHSHARKRRGCC